RIDRRPGSPAAGAPVGTKDHQGYRLDWEPGQRAWHAQRVLWATWPGALLIAQAEPQRSVRPRIPAEEPARGDGRRSVGVTVQDATNGQCSQAVQDRNIIRCGCRS